MRIRAGHAKPYAQINNSSEESDMFGLNPLGIFHAVLSLVAVTAGLIALLRDGRITSATRAGMIYILTTAITCLTAFGIFRHGGFNRAHALGIITLVVLGIAWTAGHSTLFGRASRYVETIGYSATMLFNLCLLYTS